jgi:hypothetical protein
MQWHEMTGGRGPDACIESVEIDPSFVITHRMPLEDAPKGYSIFRDKQDNCEKIVLKPQQRRLQ